MNIAIQYVPDWLIEADGRLNVLSFIRETETRLAAHHKGHYVPIVWHVDSQVDCFFF